jgi:hypothetical protein
MKSPIVPVLLGLAFIAGAIGINVQQRRIQEGDVRDIGKLRAELDSVSLRLSRASSAADSAVLGASVADRTQRLQWREFHVPSRQAAIDGWWSLTGPGTGLAVVGALLVGLGAVAGWRARTG